MRETVGMLLLLACLVGFALFIVSVTDTEANHGRPYSANVTEARQYARSHVNKGQWPCLDKLWHNESGWAVRGVTPSWASELRGAFGIPQAFPGKTMIRAIGWKDRYVGWKQARWGLNYIRNRYGTPCHALTFQNRKGYY